MKKDYTDITIILDRSGSMASVVDDTIGGFNTFLEDQKKAPGTATITLVQFDDQYEAVYRATDIQDAKRLDKTSYVPRGSTALLDAIGRTINDTGSRYDKLSETERPEKVIVVIITDGQENSSKEFAKDKINELISHQRDKYNWEFVFLGANQDAIATAASMNINLANAMTYSASGIGTQAAFKSTSSNLKGLRSGQAVSMSYSLQQKEEQEDLIKKFGN